MDINDQFLIAAEYGDVETIEILLKMPNIDVNALNDRNQNALILACANFEPRHEEAVQVLVKAGLRLNQQDYHGNTALMYAVSKDETPLAIVKLLLEGGSDIRIRDGLGDTALDWAKSYRQDLADYMVSFADNSALDGAIQSEDEINGIFSF